MSDETVERWICPECGSTNIETDSEDGSMWRCMDCDERFPKYIVPEKFVDPEQEWSDTELNGEEADNLDEESEEDLGLLGEVGEEW